MNSGERDRLGMVPTVAVSLLNGEFFQTWQVEIQFSLVSFSIIIIAVVAGWRGNERQ